MAVKKRTFKVEWDKDRERYAATDEHGELLGISPDYNNAFGSAVREANAASREAVVVVKGRMIGARKWERYVAGEQA